MKTKYKKVSVYKLDPGAKNENSHAIEEIQNLAKNIEEVGLLNPITVTPVEEDYEIIAGRARWRAFQELEREEIPAVIIKDVEEPTKSLQRADENYYRTNLDIYERTKLIWNLSKQNPESKANLSTKQLSQHFNLSQDRIQVSIAVGEFLNKASPRIKELPNFQITSQIVRHFRKQVTQDISEIPDELLKDIEDKIEEAIEDDWTRRDVQIWRKSRKEGQLKDGQSSQTGATIELERKQQEKSQPTEKQKQDREELATKAKETKEKGEKNLVEPDKIEISGKENQLNQKERELDQKDRILEQRQQKHRRERHKVQKMLANSKDNANQLRKDLQELQQEDKLQYIDRSDGLRLVEILGDLVRESENTLNTFKEVFNNA